MIPLIQFAQKLEGNHQDRIKTSKYLKVLGGVEEQEQKYPTARNTQINSSERTAEASRRWPRALAKETVPKKPDLIRISTPHRGCVYPNGTPQVVTHLPHLSFDRERARRPHTPRYTQTPLLPHQVRRAKAQEQGEGPCLGPFDPILQPTSPTQPGSRPNQTSTAPQCRPLASLTYLEV